MPTTFKPVSDRFVFLCQGSNWLNIDDDYHTVVGGVPVDIVWYIRHVCTYCTYVVFKSQDKRTTGSKWLVSFVPASLDPSSRLTSPNLVPVTYCLVRFTPCVGKMLVFGHSSWQWLTYEYYSFLSSLALWRSGITRAFYLCVCGLREGWHIYLSRILRKI